MAEFETIDPKASTENKLAKYILDFYREAGLRRREMFVMFHQARYLTYSRQSLAYSVDESGRLSFQALRSIPGVPQTQVNVVYTQVRKFISKLTQRDIDFEPVSYAASHRGIQAMMATKAHIRLLKDRYGVQELFNDVVRSMVLAGTMFLKLYTIRSGELRATAGPGGAEEMRPAREVGVSMVWPWEVSLAGHNTSCNLANHYEWLHSYALPLDVARVTLGMPDLKADGAYEILPDQLANTDIAGSGGAAGRTKGVMVHEHFDRRPHILKNYPHGRVTIVVGEKTARHIKSGPSPFPLDARHGESPMVKFDMIPVPGRAMGVSLASLLFLEQLGLNRTLNDVMKGAHIRNQVKLTAPRGAVLNPAALKELESGVIETIPGYGDEIKPIVYPPMAPESFQLIDRMVDFIQKKVGLGNVSFGKSEGRVAAASAYRILLSESDTIPSMVLRGIGRPMGELMSRLVRAYVQYADPAEIVEVVDEEGFPQQLQILREEIVKVTNFGIRVKASSLTPRNEVDLRREAMQVAEIGVKGGNVIEYLLMTDSPIIDRIAPEMIYAKEQARSENHRMAVADPEAVGINFDILQGQALDPENPSTSPIDFFLYDLPFAPHGYEIHAVHIQQHKRFMNSPQFYGLADPVKQLFEWHVQAHEMYQQRGAWANDQREIQKQAALAAAAPQGGMPSRQAGTETPATPSGENYELLPGDQQQAAHAMA